MGKLLTRFIVKMCNNDKIIQQISTIATSLRIIKRDYSNRQQKRSPLSPVSTDCQHSAV